MRESLIDMPLTVHLHTSYMYVSVNCDGMIAGCAGQDLGHVAASDANTTQLSLCRRCGFAVHWIREYARCMIRHRRLRRDAPDPRGHDFLRMIRDVNIHPGAGKWILSCQVFYFKAFHKSVDSVC